jgi:hypothetical protein
VIVETFQLSFCMFMCALHPEISSFFGKSFLFLFLLLCYPYFGIFLSTEFLGIYALKLNTKQIKAKIGAFGQEELVC